MTRATQLVLRAFVADPTREMYGLQIGQEAGLASGTIHPILARLEACGWLESCWEDLGQEAMGRPRRILAARIAAGEQIFAIGLFARNQFILVRHQIGIDHQDAAALVHRHAAPVDASQFARRAYRRSETQRHEHALISRLAEFDTAIELVERRGAPHIGFRQSGSLKLGHAGGIRLGRRRPCLPPVAPGVAATGRAR